LNDGEALERKHYLIVTIEEILKTAEEKKWSLCMSDENLYCYNGAYWKQVIKPELSSFLGRAAEKLGVDLFEARHFSFRNDLFKQFHTSAHVLRTPKKADRVMINLQNGTYVITPEKQSLEPFNREDFLTYQLGFEYDPGAQAPMFSDYLKKVLPDTTQQMILAEYVGHVFIKQSYLKLEKAMVLFGGGANGKSVFFDVVNALLGGHNVSNYSLQSLTNSSGYQRAKLNDVLLNYASEISPHMDSTIFKQLVSGEPVEARLPYKDPIILKDYAKFIFNTNILPKDVEQNEAFFRRFILIHFGVTIPEEERDSELGKKIIEGELQGVFNWVLEGLERILKNKKFTYSEAVDRAIREYRQQSDSVHLFLTDANYEPDPIKEQPLKTVYDQYKVYCIEGTYKPISLRSFSDRLKNLNYSVVRKAKGNFVGVREKIVFIEPASATLPTSCGSLLANMDVASVANVG
jgi:putative DNA primase/helicase